MALLECMDCGKDVSDKAAACPHCGCPITAIIPTHEDDIDSPKVKKSITKMPLILISIFIAAVFLCIYFIPPIVKYNSAINALKSEDYTTANINLEEIPDRPFIMKDKEYISYFVQAKLSLINSPENPNDAAMLMNKIPNKYSGRFEKEMRSFASELQIKIDEYEKSKISVPATAPEFTFAEYYIETIGCPLLLETSHINYNSIGIPLLSVSCANTSDKTIDAFTVNLYCYDNFNKRVNHYLHKNNVFKGICQETIYAGSKFDGTYFNWTVYGHENTTKFIPIITEVHFTDNTTWSLSEPAIIYAQTVADDTISSISFE